MTTRTDLDFLVHSVDLSHNLETIISDDNLPVYLIDDITRYMRFEFGLKIFNKILFEGIQSLRYDTEYDITSILNKIESISNYSSNIITKQQTKNKQKEKEEKETLNENKKSSLNIYSIPDELLYHISSYLSLKESVGLNNLNYIMFKIFHKIPKFYKNQLNESNMSWFNSYQQYIVSKCKSITNINLYHATDPSTYSSLSSFDSLQCLTISCNEFGDVDIMKHFLSVIPIQENLKKIAFHGKIGYREVADVAPRRNGIFYDYMNKYGMLIQSLCINNYLLNLTEILKCIMLNCRHLKELKLQRDAVRIYEEPITAFLCDKFIKYTNKYIDFVEFYVNEECDASMQTFIAGLIHNVKSIHLTFLSYCINAEFVNNYISSYCTMNNTQFDIHNFEQSINNQEINGTQAIKSRICYIETDQLSKLETFCVNIFGVNKSILLWICLIILNANNLRKITFINHDYWPFDKIYTKCFIKHCLENMEWMKFGVMNEDQLQIFIQVFNLYYKYHPMFKKQTKAHNNKIKYIELIFDAGKFNTKHLPFYREKNWFDWEKQIIGLMKLMSLYHELNWKISIQFEGEMDDTFRDKIWNEIRCGNWPNYCIQKHNVWKNIDFVDANGKKLGKHQFVCGILRDYDKNKYQQCDHHH